MLTLEQCAYLAAILTAVSAAFSYLYKARKKTIELNHQALAKAWTNEGDIYTNDTIFITLKLEDHDGDLIGIVSTSEQERDLEANVDVGWFKSKLYISELLGRNLFPIATVTLALNQKNNRIKWHIKKEQKYSLLPNKTVLWPLR